MQVLSWLDGQKPVSSRRRTKHGSPRSSRRKSVGCKPCIEALEDRCLPSFLAPVNYAAGLDEPRDVVTGDFNGDGRRDLTVANFRSNTVGVLLGNADGSFQPTLTSATGAYPMALAVGDFNADGKLDLATANTFDVSVLLSNGNGTFQPPTSIGLDTGPLSVAAGDFNADGKLDIAVTSGDGYDLYANVLLGNGDGSFSGPITTGLGGASSTAVADFNGDGKLDFATGSYYSSRDYDGWVSVLLGDGLGNFQPPTNTSTGSSLPKSVAAGDVNGDGTIDLVTADDDSISVLLGNGPGSFGSAQTYATGYHSGSVVLGDFNNDGNPDIGTVNQGSYPDYAGSVIAIFGIGDGAFSPPQNFAAGFSPGAVVGGDFNRDGWLDAATINFYSVSVLINDTHWPPADAPSITINDVSVTEGNTGTVGATFTVSLSAAYGRPVTVHYATADGSATASSDYTAISGDVTFAPGETSKAVSVAVLGDRLPEPTETFFINLSGATNVTIADGQGVATIVDDEPRISISDVSKKEGKKNQTTLFTFTVTLSAVYDQPVTMSYSTVNGTATTSDADYIAKTGTLTFAPGETTKTITIEVKGDSKKEADETFYLDLFGNSGNSLFTRSRAIGTILNDD